MANYMKTNTLFVMNLTVKFSSGRTVTKLDWKLVERSYMEGIEDISLTVLLLIRIFETKRQYKEGK
jgi:hypothetical protein